MNCSLKNHCVCKEKRLVKKWIKGTFKTSKVDGSFKAFYLKNYKSNLYEIVNQYLTLYTPTVLLKYH